MTVKYIYQALAMTMTKTKVCVNDDMLMDRPLDRENKKSHARRRRGNLPIANRHLSFIFLGSNTRARRLT